MVPAPTATSSGTLPLTEGVPAGGQSEQLSDTVLGMVQDRPFRDDLRELLRDRVLDAASDLVSDRGWGTVRIVDVARAAGVSRQTIYNEFGLKSRLGEALVAREADRFIAGVQEQLDANDDDLPAAIMAAVGYCLRRAAGNPLLKSILTGDRASDGLLPLLTTHSEPLLDAATQVLEVYLLRHRPGLDRAKLAAIVDATVRLSVSHIVLPLESVDLTTRRLCWLISQALELKVDCL